MRHKTVNQSTPVKKWRTSLKHSLIQSQFLRAFADGI